MSSLMESRSYRGRLAPSPTGYLHLGHARTFWIAQERARQAGGILILRNEDLDVARCRPEFVAAMFEDLRWFGLRWSEGSDVGGAFGPYNQSERMDSYVGAFEQLRDRGLVYPCSCSRRDVQRALSAPHPNDEEPIYPGTCRPKDQVRSAVERRGVNWRFRVPDRETMSLIDLGFGAQTQCAGRDFGDFVVWRKDDLPSYQLAVTLDDAAMQISEVVRGVDLISSTFRQLLIYRGLDLTPPAFCHCPLVTDAHGNRLAKRADAQSLRELRRCGFDPAAQEAIWRVELDRWMADRVQ